jgi:glycosyltransferase involved in cell wall biosynthesis
LVTVSRDERRLRVLYAESAIGFGGSGKSLLELIGCFPDVDAYLLVPSASITGSSNDVTVYVNESLAIGPDVNAMRVRRYVQDARWLWRWLWAVLVAARKVRPHVLHANNSVSGNLPVLLAGRLLGIPVVVHQRGFLAKNLRLRAALRLLRRTPVIAISRAVADSLIASGVPRENVRQIYDVVTLPADDGIAVRSVPPNVLHVGMHSVLTAWKGQITFIRAASRLHREAPGRFRFSIAGGYLPGEEKYVAKLRAEVAASGLDECLSFLGHIDNVYAFLRQLDVSVHASLTPEPLGRVIIEAQLAGVCVVAANAGGAQELVDDTSGVLVPPGDADALADALLSLAENSGQRELLAHRGRQRALDVFGGRNLAEAVRELYEEVLD